MITYDEKTNIFTLTTPNTEYAFGITPEGYVVHLYYGKKREGNTEAPIYEPMNTGEKISFISSLPLEYPFSGTGNFGNECISVRSQRGQIGLELLFDSHEIIKSKPDLAWEIPVAGISMGSKPDYEKGTLPATFGDNAETLLCTLKEEILGLTVILSYSVFDDSDAILKSAKVINNGEETLYLEKILSSCLHVPMINPEKLTLVGGWAHERQIDRVPVGTGTYTAGSKRGISSHECNPFMAVMEKETNYFEGGVYAVNLVYSGSFTISLEHMKKYNPWDPDSDINSDDSTKTIDKLFNTNIVAGIQPEGFLWKLKKGESFVTPEAVLVYSDHGLNEMTHRFHNLYREHLLPKKWVYKPRPIPINSWEAAYFDFDEEKLLNLAKSAATRGIELFVLDDGWFGHRDDDSSSLGDWYVNEKKIKGGLKELVDGIKSYGMEFGIWFEPEMVCPDSDLYREHPDWALHLRGRVPGLKRNQLVLDLTRTEVRNYIFDKLSAILKSADIKYVKWDMNRPLADVGSDTLPASRQGELWHRYVLGMYELQRSLTEAFPDLLLENCSSGGGRFDPGMLYFSPQIWCSDNTDALERMKIQEGTALVYPLSAISAHVSASPNHITGRDVPFVTRGAVALMGTFGYELDMTKISGMDRVAIAGQIKAYKRFCELIYSGDYYRIASYAANGAYDCFEVISKDKKKILIFYAQIRKNGVALPEKIKLYGLDPTKTYLLPTTTSAIPEDEAESLKRSGAELMEEGWEVPVLRGDYPAVWTYVQAGN